MDKEIMPARRSFFIFKKRGRVPNICSMIDLFAWSEIFIASLAVSDIFLSTLSFLFAAILVYK